ncbi:cellulosome protein [Streptomyces europaeiscabiei]|uniref:cellulosome protein n=2 Tax=Streptomyces europaeiscabiei TaxID=146819 RepID=UPI0029B7759C|nr:cellulosome protein [Streptomyces europaeiscabiei]MDX3837910.1 cellulosome protein [Streptomyces europaeiscabiei]MDX3845593.1 cellulosome protein [Streptomyces europaeiscabiei]
MAVGAAVAAVVTTMLAVPSAGTARAVEPERLVIDLATDTGAFHGGASGSLYGVYGDGVPSRNLIEGMRLRTVSTKAQDGPQHPGADALEILPPFVDSGGKDVYIYMTDIYRGFPYEWPGANGPARLADFQEKIKKQVRQVLTTGDYKDHVVYVPFNEPEGNMFGTGDWSYDRTSWLNDPKDFFAAWKETYHLIKSLDPDARIAGPNTSLLFDQVKGFLQYAKANDVVPDVMTWHELSSPAAVRTSVARYRQWEKEIGIDPLPINVNEYGHNYHLSVPGQVIQWVSAIEESKIDADLAYWNIDGNLNDSAVDANKGNGQWWLFNAYGQMSGHTVKVTAPHPNQQYTLQGVATLDNEKKQSRALFGGKSGDANVVFENIDPKLFGKTVHATVQEIPWTGQVGDSAQPLRLADQEVEVGTDGAVTLPMTGMNAMSAYQVILSPGGSGSKPATPSTSWRRTYEAENATYTGGGYSKNGPEGTPSDVGKFATSGDYNVGGLRTGSDGVLAFDVDVPQDGTYDLSVFANSYNLDGRVKEQGPTNVFLRVDGKDPQELRMPLGYKWVVWGHTDTTVKLTAGKHRITLSAKDTDLGVTKGDAIIDKIDLALRDEHVTQPAIYEAEYATLTGARPGYTYPGASGPGAVALSEGDSATFWVYSPTDGESTVSVDHLGGGRAALSLNGEKLDLPKIGNGKPRTDTVKMFLSAGVNKITVTGISRELVLDRLRVAPSSGSLVTEVYQADAGTLSGTAKATEAYTFAEGGKAVTDIGNGKANALTLDVVAERAGRHAVTIRYSNAEQAPATHYNPDPIARHADLSVNGGPARRVLFPTTFHFNSFRDLTVPVTLKKGTNRLTFTAEELPDFDGDSYNQYDQRSAYAPVIDQVAVTPLTEK